MQLQSTDSTSHAHTWFMNNLPEIQSRSNACFARLTPDRRQEALAEVVAVVFKAVDSAARRGVIARITPFHLVDNAARQFRQGRRIAGSSSTDVMGEATRRQGRAGVVSMSERRPESGDEQGTRLCLAETLADRRVDQRPDEQVRLKMDYAQILKCERVSPQARRVFRLLSAVRGCGSVHHIAQALKVSPGRVCHLKGELARALACYTHHPHSFGRERQVAMRAIRAVFWHFFTNAA